MLNGTAAINQAIRAKKLSTQVSVQSTTNVDVGGTFILRINSRVAQGDSDELLSCINECEIGNIASLLKCLDDAELLSPSLAEKGE